MLIPIFLHVWISLSCSLRICCSVVSSKSQATSGKNFSQHGMARFNLPVKSQDFYAEYVQLSTTVSKHVKHQR